MLHALCLAVLPWLAGLPLAAAAPASAVSSWRAVLADYDRHLRETDPLRAALLGDADALSRWPDDSASALAQRRQRLQGLKARLATLAAARLPAEDALGRDLLAERVELELQALDFDEARACPISRATVSTPYPTTRPTASCCATRRRRAPGWPRSRPCRPITGPRPTTSSGAPPAASCGRG